MLSRSALCPLTAQWVVWTHYLLLYPALLNGQIPTKQTSHILSQLIIIYLTHIAQAPDMSHGGIMRVIWIKMYPSAIMTVSGVGCVD